MPPPLAPYRYLSRPPRFPTHLPRGDRRAVQPETQTKRARGSLDRRGSQAHQSRRFSVRHNHGKRWSGKDSRGTFRNGQNLVPGVVL